MNKPGFPYNDLAVSLNRAALLNDPDAQVATLLAIADLPPSDAVGSAFLAILKKDENAKDRWIPHAATVAAPKNDSSFLKALLTGVTSSH